MTIVGSKRMVVYEDGGAEAIKIFDRGVDYKDPETFGEYHLSYRSGDILSPKLETDEPLALQVADFLRAVALIRAVPCVPCPSSPIPHCVRARAREPSSVDPNPRRSV